MEDLITLFGLAFALFGSPGLVLAVKNSDWLPPRYTVARYRIGLGLNWCVAIALLAFVVLIENRSLASIGLRFTGVEMLLEVVFGFIIVGWMAIGSAFLFKYVGFYELDSTAVFLVGLSPRWKVISALSTGIIAGIVFQGYLIERTLELTGSTVLAGTISVVAFSLAYIQGRKIRGVLPAIVGVGVGSVVAYLIFRNVFVLAFVHAFIVALSLLSTTPEEALEEMDTSALDERIVSLASDE